MFSLGELTGALVDAVVPSRCAACGDPARGLCPGCVRALGLLPQPAEATLGAVRLQAAFLYSSPLRELMHVGKYRDGRSALRIAALLAAERFAVLPPPSILVPVPLGAARRRARGYNQAEIVAGVVATVVGAVARPWLARVRETRSQVGRSPAQRASNLAGAFAWVGPEHVAGRIWVVDDVITTGATMQAATVVMPGRVRGGLCGVALARAGDHLRPGSGHLPRGVVGS